MKGMIFTILSTALILIFATSCSQGPQWTLRHPQFRTQQVTQLPVAYIELGDRWIVVRSSWFAKRLSLEPSQVYDSLGTWIHQSINESLQQQWPKISQLESHFYDSLPPQESVRLDSNIYAKIRIPAQGQIISQAPKHVLIIHEITLGPDIQRNMFYDHTQANQSGEIERRKANQVTAMALWTLWDNELQANLLTSVSQVAIPVTESMNLRSDINLLLQKLAQRMLCESEKSCL